jgi:endonuclease/exonuclease/phosphatase (EEP) superfamily protein YafD
MTVLITAGRLLVSTNAAVGMLVVVSALAAVQHIDWRFECLAHWRLQYAVAAAALAILLFFLRRYRPAAVALAVSASHLTVWLPLVVPSEVATRADSPTDASLRIAAFNVNAGNTRFAETISWIEASGAAVAVLIEVSAAWERAIGGLTKTFPYRYASPGLRDEDGLVVWSKYPLHNAETWYPGGGQKQAIKVDVQTPAAFTLIGVHPRPPVNGRWAGERELYLNALAAALAQQSLPVVAAGDFNMTPYSYLYADFLARSGVVRPPGRTATWPALLGPAGIEIDHLFAGKGAEITFISAGPHLGSDHRPIIGELQLRTTR